MSKPPCDPLSSLTRQEGPVDNNKEEEREGDLLLAARGLFRVPTTSLRQADVICEDEPYGRGTSEYVVLGVQHDLPWEYPHGYIDLLNITPAKAGTLNVRRKPFRRGVEGNSLLFAGHKDYSLGGDFRALLKSYDDEFMIHGPARRKCEEDAKRHAMMQEQSRYKLAASCSGWETSMNWAGASEPSRTRKGD